MSNENPLVSIVITCHNYGRYVGQAIESALGQTYRQVEVIVVNDGSTDDTVEIVSRYPVTLINQTNQGPAQASNAGVHKSHGELLTILNADDVLHPQFLDYTVLVLITWPEIGFVYTHAVTFGTEHAVLLSQEFNWQNLGQGGFMGGSCLMRRSVFDAVGGFDPALRHGEDWDLWISLAERGYIGQLVPRILFAYRKHGQGLAETNPLWLRWRSLAYLYRKHPKLLQWHWLARLAAYDVLFLLTAKARQLSPRGYEWLRRRLQFMKPRLGGVERKRAAELEFLDSEDYGYGEMIRYLVAIGCLE